MASRQANRRWRSQNKGALVEFAIEVNPYIPKPLVIPQGYTLKGAHGVHVKTIKAYTVKPRLWWKVALWFNKQWQYKLKVQGTVI